MTLNYQSPAGYSPNLPPHLLRSAIKPLRMIFWGALLLIFDITFSSTTNGVGFKCDILDDTVGMILISVAVFRLAKFPVSRRYANMMTFIKIICILKLIASIDGHFIYEDPPYLGFFRTLLEIADLVAIVLFCTAMRDLARQAAFNTVADSWNITRLLFILIYILPLGFLYLAGLSFELGLTSSFNLNLGLAFLPLIFVFVIPVIHFFISTSRFKREIETFPRPLYE